MRMRFTKTAIGILIAAVFFLLISNLPRAIGDTFFYVFQARDLARAAEFLHGHLIFFGPETTGGGNLPGSFYYFLLSIMLLFNHSWISAWLGMVNLAAAAAGIGWMYLRKDKASWAGVLFVILLAISPQTKLYFQIFVNPSYTILFMTAGLIAGVEAFRRTDRRRELAFVFSALMAGLSIQLHFTAAFLFLALLFLQGVAPKIGYVRVSQRAFYWGVAAFLLPMLPYLIWWASALKADHLGFDLHASMGALVHFAELVFNVSLKDFILNFLSKTIYVTPPALLVLLFCLALKWIFYGRKFIEGNLKLIKLWSLFGFFGFIPYSYVYLVPIGSRYGMLFYLALIFLTIQLIDEALNSEFARKAFNLTASIIFGCFAIFLAQKHLRVDRWDWIGFLVSASVPAALGIRSKRALPLFLAVALSCAQLVCVKSGYDLIPQSERMTYLFPLYNQWKKIWFTVVSETGWSYETAKNRLFFVNLHSSASAELAYKAVVQNLPQRRRPGNLPDGFFVTGVIPKGTKFSQWIQSQPVPDFVKQGLVSGSIKIGSFQRGWVNVIPYYVKSASMPRYFHDVGIAYAQPDHNSVLASAATVDGVDRSGNSYFFHWNECSGHSKYCTAGMLVDVRADRIEVQVVGAPLSQNSPWDYPQFTLAWLEPYLEISCGGTTQRFVIADSVGYNRKYTYYLPSSRFLIANNSVLAPFGRTYSIKCNGKKISRIAAGRNASLIESLVRNETRSAPELSVQISH